MKRVGAAVFAIARGETWWSSLPNLPGHQEMIEYAQDLVGIENVYICTAPVQDKDGGCERGKRNWVAQNTSIPENQVYVTNDKASVLSNFPGETCILVDDRTKYCEAWQNGVVNANAK